MVLLLVAAILATLLWTSARWVVSHSVAFEQITGTAAVELKKTGGRFALATMCVGVGQGTAILIERV